MTVRVRKLHLMRAAVDAYGQSDEHLDPEEEDEEEWDGYLHGLVLAAMKEEQTGMVSVVVSVSRVTLSSPGLHRGC
jgi:hypothetical protein